MERAILLALIERLEPEVGPCSLADLSMYGDHEVLPRPLAWYMLARALLGAREALESGDEEQIRKAATACQSFERSAREGAARTKRRRGGQEGGLAEKAKANERFEKRSQEFARRAEGKDRAGQLAVRALLFREMEKSGERLPSRPASAKWFPVRKK